jgi:hypothetical protein
MLNLGIRQIVLIDTCFLCNGSRLVARSSIFCRFSLWTLHRAGLFRNRKILSF